MTTLETPRRPILAASVAVFRDGKVLLAQRGKPPAAGLWSLPGGRVERGEGLADCARRELMEEVGVSARDLAFVDHVELISEEFHAVICAFAGHWVAGEAQTGPEAQAVRWCAPEDVSQLPTTHRLAEVIAKAKTVIERA